MLSTALHPFLLIIQKLILTPLNLWPYFWPYPSQPWALHFSTIGLIPPTIWPYSTQPLALPHSPFWPYPTHHLTLLYLTFGLTKLTFLALPHSPFGLTLLNLWPYPLTLLALPYSTFGLTLLNLWPALLNWPHPTPPLALHYSTSSPSDDSVPGSWYDLCPNVDTVVLATAYSISLLTIIQ